MICGNLFPFGLELSHAALWLTLGAAPMRVASAAVPVDEVLPPVNEILQGRVFRSTFEREVFFLRQVHEAYPKFWDPLLRANINVSAYERAASKLLRFAEQLGTAMERSNDLPACTNLAAIVSNPAYYANTNGYYPGVLRAAAQALIKIGPGGEQALAQSFTEHHYRTDSTSLEDLADVVGKSRTPAAVLENALAATAFQYATADGGSFARCTTTVVRNLLRLPHGAEIVAFNLSPDTVLKDPARYQSVIDGIAAEHAAALGSKLIALQPKIDEKQSVLANSPGSYRDELEELGRRVQRALASLRVAPAE